MHNGTGKIQDYNEFYTHTDWKIPEVSKGVARIKLYFQMGALYCQTLTQPSLRVLDVGCGTGFYTHCLNLAGFAADGLDYSEVAVEQARKRWGTRHKFMHGDGSDLSAYRGQYNIIFARGLSLYNTCDPKVVGQLTNHYLSIVKPSGAVMVIVSTDLTGTNPGWINCTYPQLQTLFSQVQGDVIGPLFFDYRLVSLIFALRVKVLTKILLWSLHKRVIVELLALVARYMGVRVPMLFLVTHAQESL